MFVVKSVRVSCVLCEFAVDKGTEAGNSRFFVSAVRNDADADTADDAERQNAQEALAVYAALFLFDPDGRLEFVSLLDEESCRTCMKTDLIFYDYIFYEHNILSVSKILIDELRI